MAPDSGARQVRWCLLAFVLLLLYDGALRKWVFPAQEQVVFLLKDVLLIFAMGWMLATRRFMTNLLVHRAVTPLLVLYFMWILLDAFNPWLPNAAVALWGVKSYGLYAIAIPLLLSRAFQTSEDLLETLQRIYPWLVAPIGLLGIAQVLSPADSVLNAQVRGDIEALAYFGNSNLVRVSGTFSYISGMAAFVQIACLLGFGLFLGGARKPAFLLALGLAFACIPVTGSRGVVVVTVLAFAIMLGAAASSGLIQVKLAFRIAVAGVILGAGSFVMLSDVWQALQERADSTYEETDRSVTAFTNAFDYFEVAGVAGFGTGSANLGASALAADVPPFSWLPNNLLFEEESGRIVIELGVLGWSLALLFRLALLMWSLALAWRATARTGRIVGVMTLPVMASALYQGIGVFAAPVWSAYVWFCFAALAMVHFEQKTAARGAAIRRAR